MEHVMSKAIGEVTRIDGEYIVKSGDGSLKILAPGTLLFEDDVIQGRGGSRELEIELVNGDKLVLGGDEVVTLSESVISKEPFDTQDTQIEPEQIVSKADSSDWIMNVDPEMITGSIEPEHFVARAFLDHDENEVSNIRAPSSDSSSEANESNGFVSAEENVVVVSENSTEKSVESAASAEAAAQQAARSNNGNGQNNGNNGNHYGQEDQTNNEVAGVESNNGNGQNNGNNGNHYGQSHEISASDVAREVASENSAFKREEGGNENSGESISLAGLSEMAENTSDEAEESLSGEIALSQVFTLDQDPSIALFEEDLSATTATAVQSDNSSSSAAELQELYNDASDSGLVVEAPIEIAAT
jgi:hypothetical protein